MNETIFWQSDLLPSLNDVMSTHCDSIFDPILDTLIDTTESSSASFVDHVPSLWSPTSKLDPVVTSSTSVQGINEALPPAPTMTEAPNSLPDNDVFGFRNFSDTFDFVSACDLARAAAKLDEPEKKTAQDKIQQSLDVLMQFSLESSPDVNQVSAFGVVSICVGFTVLGQGRLQVEDDLVCWEGILHDLVSNIQPKDVCLKIPLDILSNIRSKTLPDEDPMLLLTLNDSLFMQFCFESDTSAHECTELLQRMARGKAPIRDGPGGLTSHVLPAEPRPRLTHSQTPRHKTNTTFDHLKITRTTIKSKSYMSLPLYDPKNNIDDDSDERDQDDDFEEKEEYRKRVHEAALIRDGIIKAAQEEFESKKHQIRQEIDLRIKERKLNNDRTQPKLQTTDENCARRVAVDLRHQNVHGTG
ncbi:hypothetical protein SmJEL517_g03414 [Synchytrium microbalum]|uniref:Uncharacterized protein n=1 Tax=Synchytrium microbalum TaxID=1806994 RepID=A0A507C705_9FUNG|nr:uncharacterized protein SmJEL517_g03414 [Synchytrium microbalum]TPX33776.1 hypothetical protein SmJEL517_g03414 [Synchytrium microbalum]